MAAHLAGPFRDLGGVDFQAAGRQAGQLPENGMPPPPVAAAFAWERGKGWGDIFSKSLSSRFGGTLVPHGVERRFLPRRNCRSALNAFRCCPGGPVVVTALSRDSGPYLRRAQRRLNEWPIIQDRDITIASPALARCDNNQHSRSAKPLLSLSNIAIALVQSRSKPQLSRPRPTDSSHAWVVNDSFSQTFVAADELAPANELLHDADPMKDPGLLVSSKRPHWGRLVSPRAGTASAHHAILCNFAGKDRRALYRTGYQRKTTPCRLIPA
jgi:hypothetical protein